MANGYSADIVHPKDDANAVSRRLVSVTDDNRRVVNYTLDYFGTLVNAVTNQTYNTGANPTLASFQQTDNTYDVTSVSLSHGWLT